MLCWCIREFWKRGKQKNNFLIYAGACLNWGLWASSGRLLQYLDGFRTLLNLGFLRLRSRFLLFRNQGFLTAQRAILLGSCLHLVLTSEITIKVYARKCAWRIEFRKQILVFWNPGYIVSLLWTRQGNVKYLTLHGEENRWINAKSQSLSHVSSVYRFLNIFFYNILSYIPCSVISFSGFHWLVDSLQDKKL